MSTRRNPARLALALAILIIAMLAAPAVAAVILADFDAKSEPPSTVHLAWRTDAEEDNKGFYLYRRDVRDDASGVEDPTPIAFVPSTAPPSGLGASYRYTDTVPGPGAYLYWLEDLDEKGNVTDHPGAVVEIVPEPPTAVSLVSLDAGSDGLTCRRVNQGCECYIRNSKGTPLGWRSRPMLWCKLAGV